MDCIASLFQKLFIILFLVSQINAFCIENKNRHTATVEVKGFYKTDLETGYSTCCHYKTCGGSREKSLQVWIDIAGALNIISLQADGCAIIFEDMTMWNWPKTSILPSQPYSVSYKPDLKVEEQCTWNMECQEPYISYSGKRSVHFLATADPQYWIPDGSPVKVVPDRTLASMEQMMGNSNDMRGALVAGDLTEWADYYWANYDAYNSAII